MNLSFFSRLLALVLLVAGLTSCLFKEPVFTSGFSKVDGKLAGVWMCESENHDPRERQYAVVAQVGDALMIHYPVNEKGGCYFEARPLQVRGRTLLQARCVATYDDGLPRADQPVYTVLWVEQTGADALTIRSLANEGPQTASPEAARKALEAKEGDWTSLFGEAVVFTRLADKG